MVTRWFEDLPEGDRLSDPLLRLAGAVSRTLDGLATPPVAPASGRIDAAASAVILPVQAVPGCCLVVHVAEWSSSVACWWSAGTDWRVQLRDPELFAELPLQPDGVAGAVAWLERELRRPVAARSRSYGPVRRRRWVVVADDGAELTLRQRWLPAWRGAGEGGAAPAGLVPGPGSWLLGAAVAAAVARSLLAVLTPGLLEASWLHWAARVLDVAAFAALLAWFRAAGGGRPARLRAPMRAGLLLATLGAALVLLSGSGDLPSPGDSPVRVLRLVLLGSLPDLLGAVAIGCYLVGFRRLPAPRTARPPWPRVLPAVAGLAWGIDAAVGLWWLAQLEPSAPEEAALIWPGVLLSAIRAAAVALAVVLAFVVADRRPALTRPAARAGLAGALLLVLAWSLTPQLATSWLASLLPQALAAAAFGPVMLASFAGTALLAVAAAAPQAPSRAEGSPNTDAPTASPRNPTARPGWGG
jgi:hypothetical protein